MTQRVLIRTIGFATCSQYRNLTADDRILAAALEKRGIKVVPVVWTETNAESLQCDLLVVRSVWDYHLRPQDFMRWIDGVSGRMPVLNPPEMIRWNMDKRYLLEIEAAGFPLPRTLYVAQGADVDLESVMRLGGLKQAVVKPVISASAYETRRIAEPGAAHDQWLNGMLKHRPMMVQEFIAEIQSAGEWSLIFAGMEFTHAVHKAPKPGDFRVQEEHGGLHRAAAPPADALVMTQEILRRFAPQAVYCRVDLVMRDGQPLLMELELIEPLLHFELAPEAAEVMAAKLTADGSDWTDLR
jgi:glutathione synthase/RimK-type ligase-like ATP-grasp enzyme